MTEFKETLKQDRFLVTAEIKPPPPGNTEGFLDLARDLSGKVNAIVVCDNPGASCRMGAVGASVMLMRKEVLGDAALITVLACRDRNRLAMASEALAAGALGLSSLFLVSGDFVTLGDQPGAKPVYDLDSVQALNLITGLNEGHGPAGSDFLSPYHFFTGCAVSLKAQPLAAQLMKLNKKLSAGAGFIITLPLNHAQDIKNLNERIPGLSAPVLAGVSLSGEADPAELTKEIKSGGLARGVHVFGVNAADQLEPVLEAAA